MGKKLKEILLSLSSALRFVFVLGASCANASRFVCGNIRSRTWICSSLHRTGKSRKAIGASQEKYFLRKIDERKWANLRLGPQAKNANYDEIHIKNIEFAYQVLHTARILRRDGVSDRENIRSTSSFGTIAKKFAGSFGVYSGLLINRKFVRLIRQVGKKKVLLWSSFYIILRLYLRCYMLRVTEPTALNPLAHEFVNWERACSEIQNSSRNRV